MKPALIITHLDDRQTGIVPACLHQAGLETLEVDGLADSGLPGITDIAGVVSLGGRVSATRADSHPSLAAEVKLISAALEAGVPVLGMCLGAQLLAVAAGGAVRPIGEMYVGWPELSPLPAGAGDRLVGELPATLPVLEWHEDMIELPPGAVELGRTPAPGAALFALRDAPAWGSQAHLELDLRMLVDTWLAGPDDAAEIEAAGHDIEHFRALSRHHLKGQMAAARRIFLGFGKLVRERELSRRGPRS
ncbi:MAG: type 1 glutamine amidotransferase [Solirubrobacteraceae bacterium]